LETGAACTADVVQAKKRRMPAVEIRSSGEKGGKIRDRGRSKRGVERGKRERDAAFAARRVFRSDSRKTAMSSLVFWRFGRSLGRHKSQSAGFHGEVERKEKIAKQTKLPRTSGEWGSRF